MLIYFFRSQTRFGCYRISVSSSSVLLSQHTTYFLVQLWYLVCSNTRFPFVLIVRYALYTYSVKRVVYICFTFVAYIHLVLYFVLILLPCTNSSICTYSIKRVVYICFTFVAYIHHVLYFVLILLLCTNSSICRASCTCCV